MATRLENGTYLLDDAERQAYLVAARMIERVDHRAWDLTQPLPDVDYLLLLCAHLLLAGEDDVAAMVDRLVSECREERRRSRC